MIFTIVDGAHFSHRRGLTNKALRKQLKIEFGIQGRRLDNFTLSGLAACHLLFNKLPEECGQGRLSLFSSSQYFSIERLQALLTEIDQDMSIKPLDFIATVGNAANFYIAQQFNLLASNLFIGTSEHAFYKNACLASCDAMLEPERGSIFVIWQDNMECRQCFAFYVKVECNLGESNISQLPTDIEPRALLELEFPAQISF